MNRWTMMTKFLVGLMLAAVIGGLWTGPAAAADPPAREYTRLEYALKYGLIRLDALQDRIDTTTEVVDLAEALAAEQRAEGYDTTDLEAALVDIRTQIAEAQQLHDDSARILEEKAGFDDAGQVIDPEQAVDTLKAAGRTMREAHQTLRQARQDLRQALAEYRRSRQER